MNIHIAPDNTGDFVSIADALSSIPHGYTGESLLHIHRGVYRERVTITHPNITLVGDSCQDTVLTYDLSANMTMKDNTRRGTFRTYSCFIDTHDVTFKNLSVANTAGPGPVCGQAIALYGDGDRLMFDNCRFLGGQDTLFTGPLPPKELEPGGFVGPKQFSPRVNGRHYYRNCYLEGDIDFVFGSATAYFENCEFFSKDIGKSVNSYVTAASTPQGQTYGYVMEGCRFTGSCPPRSAYLGRPWREYAQTVLINCYMDQHIFPEGWHDWGKTMARDTCFFAEYNSFGPGGDMTFRPAWVHRLTWEELPFYSRQRVLAGDDGWQPWSLGT